MLCVRKKVFCLTQAPYSLLNQKPSLPDTVRTTVLVEAFVRVMTTVAKQCALVSVVNGTFVPPGDAPKPSAGENLKVQLTSFSHRFSDRLCRYRGPREKTLEEQEFVAPARKSEIRFEGAQDMEL